MKRLLLFLLVCIFQFQNSFCQNPLVKQWDKRFGGSDVDFLSSVIQTRDDGYILGGVSFSDSSGDKTQANWSLAANIFDFWIVKLDSSGSKEWDIDFGGTNDDELFVILQTNDGGYLFGGTSNSGIGGEKTQDSWGGYDFWIIKVDSLGNKLWDKDFGGTGNDILYSLLQTKDRGFILGGTSNSSNNGNKSQSNWGGNDFWVIKIDSIGNKIWDKDYGGTGNDGIFSIGLAVDSGFILGGYSGSCIGGDKSQDTIGGLDFWIIRIDSVGNKLWDKDFGGTFEDILYSLQGTVDGGYILGGTSNSGLTGDKTQANWGGFDYWIVKVDSVGNKLWDKDFGGTLWEDQFGNISQTSDNGYLLAGTSYSPVGGNKTENNLGAEQTWIVKTDSNGNFQWDKTIKTNGSLDDEFGFALQNKTGYYIVANSTNGGIGGDKTQSCQGSWDYWIIKFGDSTLFYFPIVNLSSSDTTFCGKQCLNFFDLSTNNPTSWQWFFPGADSSSSNEQNPTGICYNSFGSFDVTLIACNAAGCDTLYLPNFIKEFANPPVPVITSNFDTLFSSPAYSYQWYDSIAVFPGATGSYYIFQQPGSYYVIVTDSIGCATSSNTIYTGINEVFNTNENIKIIPNPSSGDFSVTGIPVNSLLKIFDITGRILYSNKTAHSPEHIHFAAAPGIYFLEISKAQGRSSLGDKHVAKKMVVIN